MCLHTHGEVGHFGNLKRANLLLVNLVQNLSKSVDICKSYRKKFTGTFYGPQCRIRVQESKRDFTVNKTYQAQVKRMAQA